MAKKDQPVGAPPAGADKARGRSAADADQPEATPAQTPGEAALAACAELFSGGLFSSEIGRLFDARFKGKSVRWAGKLLWVDSAAFDMSLGAGAVSRAVLEICPAQPGLTGGRAVQALVRVTGAEVDDLRSRVGQTVAFQGVLTGCDGFARNIYVTDATIEAP